MAARKRTIERAPTKPNDRAREDLTMVMISMVVVVMRTKLWEKRERLLMVVAKRL